MVSDMLSQDEIDALLNGGESDPASEENSLESVDTYLTPMQQDALGEIGNISFGSAATTLSTLLNQKVDITTPQISVITKSRLVEEFPQPHVAVQVEYTEGFQGANILVIRKQDAEIIADLMLGGDGTNPSPDLGEIHLSAVQEAMNQMMGSAATSMSTIFSKKVDISPPSIDILDVKQDGSSLKIDDILIKVSFRLTVGELIDSNIMQLLPVPFAKSLVEELLNPKQANPEQASQDVEPKVSQLEQPSAPAESTQEPSVDPAQKQSETQAPPSYQQPSMPHPTYEKQRPVHVQPASFSEFAAPSLNAEEARNLDMLLDIPLQVTVELGRTKRTIKEILELSPGSIVELDKLAGEPVDILVNNKLVAKGEVVVIDENFGVRVTEITSQSERLKKLQ